MDYFFERKEAVEESKNLVEVVSRQVQDVLSKGLDAKDFRQTKNYGFSFVLEDCRFKMSIIRIKK